jgi:hypothetical protein
MVYESYILSYFKKSAKFEPLKSKIYLKQSKGLFYIKNDVFKDNKNDI